jgi:N-acetylmuramoyl-L-alanine amidase
MVLYPISAAGQNSANGIISCRDASGQWEAAATPASTRDALPNNSALLIFLFHSGAKVRRELRVRAAAGPLARTTPTVSPLELGSDAIAYAYSGQLLLSTAWQGKVQVTAEEQPSPKYMKAYSTSLISFFNTITPSGIILHHTSAIPDKGRAPANEKELDEYHDTRGFDVICAGKEYHVAYHYIIFPDGKIEEGRPDRCEGAHAQGYNSYLGISIVGDFSSTDNAAGSKGLTSPTAAEIKSLITLSRKLRKQYNIPLQRILRHSDVAPTQCPGDKFPFENILAQIARGD